ncbi:MAG: integrase core domain-containing protein [Clostridia bacterium]|nr:integrase core domain-containing protein [Clostridia bacterium]
MIFHSDRGSAYRSKTLQAHLAKLGITQSFSRPYLPYDNSVVESFFSSLKRKELYRTKYRSENEFRTAVNNYITFFNAKRPHSKNQYKTPDETELEYCKKTKELS